MEPVTLTTDRLLLRPFTIADTDAVFEACQDPEIPRWTTIPSPYTREHARAWTERIAPDGWRLDTAYNFAVTSRADGSLAGAMGLVRLQGLPDGPRRVAELGYWTGPEHRGRGLTTEAARAVAHWALAELRVERLEWYAEAGNERSWAVARAVGFHREGTLRGYTHHRGTRRDAWVGSLLPSDLGLRPAVPYVPWAGAADEG
jgi:RimJ/RimL family protein N-acetyltransferase